MSEYVTKGATMMCTGGTAPSKLQVTSNSLFSVQGNKAATVSDKIPNTNIMPFGNCKLKSFSPPCVASPTAWTGFLTSVGVPGGNPLLKTSTIQCACGGMISFQDSGQIKANKVQLKPDTPQIRALKKAAFEATPFCEECEKKKVQKEPKITNIYWVDEEGEMRRIDELHQGEEVTLCIDVEEGNAGKTVDLTITADENKTFMDGNTQQKYQNLNIESDNTAYIDNFKVEYKDETK